MFMRAAGLCWLACLVYAACVVAGCCLLFVAYWLLRVALFVDFGVACMHDLLCCC